MSNLMMSICLFVSAGPAWAQAATPYDVINRDAAQSPITAQALRGNVTVLQGSGGNIGVLSGPEGLLMVDAGISVSKQKIQEALRRIGPGRLRYVINTHWHWDHADGNGWVRDKGAVLLASPRAIARLKETVRVEEWGHTFKPHPQPELPDRTVREAMTLRFSGQDVRVRPYEPGHTDGDLSVYFPKADVLQVGDTWWNGMYPFIDHTTGGSIDGAIKAANKNLALATDRTIIIPGHGPVGNRAELAAFRDMLVAIRAKVVALKAAGKTLDQAVAEQPTREYDHDWGGGLINGALFTALVYKTV